MSFRLGKRIGKRSGHLNHDRTVRKNQNLLQMKMGCETTEGDYFNPEKVACSTKVIELIYLSQRYATRNNDESTIDAKKTRAGRLIITQTLTMVVFRGGI